MAKVVISSVTNGVDIHILEEVMKFVALLPPLEVDALYCFLNSLALAGWPFASKNKTNKIKLWHYLQK